MLFEDVGWIDPTSLEAPGQVVDLIATLRVLLVVTFRPEVDLPWIGQPHVTALTLNRLERRDVSAMIDEVALIDFRSSLAFDISFREVAVSLILAERAEPSADARPVKNIRPCLARVPQAGRVSRPTTAD